jgi:hypothetical protein
VSATYGEPRWPRAIVRGVAGALVVAILAVSGYLALRDDGPRATSPARTVTAIAPSPSRTVTAITPAAMFPSEHLPKICSTFAGWDHPDLCGNQEPMTLREALTIWPPTAFRVCAHHQLLECPPSDLVRQFCQTIGGCG